MSHTLKLFISLVALSALPVLSACNTGRGVDEDRTTLGHEGRGAETAGEEGTSGEGMSGIVEEEEEGTAGPAREGAAGISGQTGEGAEGTTQ